MAHSRCKDAGPWDRFRKKVACFHLPIKSGCPMEKPELIPDNSAYWKHIEQNFAEEKDRLRGLWIELQAHQYRIKQIENELLKYAPVRIRS